MSLYLTTSSRQSLPQSISNLTTMSCRENVCVKKRANTLIKKTSELATLCGTDSLIIILDHTNPGSDQSRPITWPENPEEINRILKRYRDYNESNGLDRKRRKIQGDQKVLDTSSDDPKLVMELIDLKLSAVEARLRELEEADPIQCDGGAWEEAYASVDDSFDWSLLILDEEDALISSVASSDAECVGIDYGWDSFGYDQFNNLLTDGFDFEF